MDIGCGKGVVLRVAAGYPFEKVAGIEIDERLAAIAANLQHSYEQSIAGEGKPYAEVFDELERSLV